MLMRRWLCLLLWVGVLAGCNNAAPVQVHSGKIGGVTYEVRGTGLTKENRSNGDLDVSVGSNHLQIKGGQVVANGKSWGVVKDGDTVILDDKGQVSVRPSRGK